MCVDPPSSAPALRIGTVGSSYRRKGAPQRFAFGAGRCGAQGGRGWWDCGFAVDVLVEEVVLRKAGACGRRPGAYWCVTAGFVFSSVVATSHCRIGVQDGCQSRRLHALLIYLRLQNRKLPYARCFNAEKLFPGGTHESSNQEKRRARCVRLPRLPPTLAIFWVFFPGYLLSGSDTKLVLPIGPIPVRREGRFPLAHIEESDGYARLCAISSRDRGRHSSPSAVRGPAVLQNLPADRRYR